MPIKAVMDGNSLCRFIVSSESDHSLDYVVDLCEYPIGLNENGTMVFNGACGLTHARIQGCADFRFRCEPKLKDPSNMGKAFRCKHITAARAAALDFVLPHLKKADPNVHEDFQP